LIVRLSSRGDLIHTIPAFQSLRRAFPEARIDWLVERRLEGILGAVAGIDQVLPIDTQTMRMHLLRRDGWQQLWEPIRAVRDRRYDVAIDFQGLLKTAFLSFLSGAKTRIGFSKALVRERPAHWFYHRFLQQPDVPIHVVRLNLLLAQVAGAGEAGIQVNLEASEPETAAIENRLRQQKLSEFIVINPGGGWPTKRWHPSRYGALAARIRKELDCRVVVTTGPGEEPLYQEISEASGGQPPAHLPVPFLQLIPLFKRARLLIAGDTGPFYLACALGTPVVGILGPTSPVRNGPWSPADEVVVRRLPCSFCNGRTCPTAMECMDISVDHVFAAVVRRLERAK
jgi:lipopolysaccharide heptosyltransferase I